MKIIFLIVVGLFKYAYGMNSSYTNKIYNRFDPRAVKLYTEHQESIIQIEADFLQGLSSFMQRTSYVTFKKEYIFYFIKNWIIEYHQFLKNNHNSTTFKHEKIIQLLQIFVFIDKKFTVFSLSPGLQNTQQFFDRNFNLAIFEVFEILKKALLKDLLNPNYNILSVKKEIISECFLIFSQLKINLSFFIWGLAKSYERYSVSESHIRAITQILIRHMLYRVAELNAQDLSTTIWALVKLQEQAKLCREELTEMIELFLDQIKQKIQYFNAKNVSTVIWVLAKIREREEISSEKIVDTVNLLIKQIQKVVYDFNTPYSISNTIYGLAKLNKKMNLSSVETASALQALILQMKNKIQNFTPRDLSDTIWGFAQLSELIAISAEETRAVISILILHVQHKIHAFNLKEMSKTTWGFLKINDAIIIPSERMTNSIR